MSYFTIIFVILLGGATGLAGTAVGPDTPRTLKCIIELGRKLYAVLPTAVRRDNQTRTARKNLVIGRKINRKGTENNRKSKNNNRKNEENNRNSKGNNSNKTKKRLFSMTIFRLSRCN